jgi:hypothetical protein
MGCQVHLAYRQMGTLIQRSVQSKGLEEYAGKVCEGGNHFLLTCFDICLSNLSAQLPDMDFPINAKAEGHVIIPWKKRELQNSERTS